MKHYKSQSGLRDIYADAALALKYIFKFDGSDGRWDERVGSTTALL